METNFNFKSAICTSREQSERLLSLGLKKETADCYYWQENDHIYGEATGVWHLETLDSHDNQEHFEYLDKYFGVCLAADEEHYFIPAWSLGRLIKLMPRTIVMHFPTGEAPDTPIEREVYAQGILISDDSIAETVLTIEWLIKEGYFNKEYLENGN